MLDKNTWTSIILTTWLYEPICLAKCSHKRCSTAQIMKDNKGQRRKKRKQKNLCIRLFRVSKINGNNWSTMQPEAFETNIVPTNVYGLNLHPLLNGFAQNNYSNRVHKVSLNRERLIEAFLNDV